MSAMPPHGRKQWTKEKRVELERDRAAFGNNLRARREKLDVSQKLLAKRCGISLKTINGIEWGHVFPSFPIYCRLCRSLRINTIPLVTWT